jgi:hypothetical protein
MFARHVPQIRGRSDFDFLRTSFRSTAGERAIFGAALPQERACQKVGSRRFIPPPE